MPKIKATPFWMFLVNDAHKLEHDAQTQYKFNRSFAMLWFCGMCAIPCLPTLYAHNIASLIIIEISLWANFATHFGAMSASLAAMNTTSTVQEVAEDVADISEDVSDINQVTRVLASDPVPAES